MALHLKKADTGEIFHERSYEELLKWAHSAQINPMDEISQDGKNWVLARTIPEFEMEWTVQLADGETYGPTNIGTLKEFLQANLLRNDSIAHHINGSTTEKVKNLLSGKPSHNKSAPQTQTQQTQTLGKKNPFKNLASSSKSTMPTSMATPRIGPKIRDYHTQPLPIPAYLRTPPPQGVLLPSDSGHHPLTDTDPE